ncbi:hypothetical protein ASD99_29625 [Mesorhizobium sp. Root695]|nr:hypothetical protein ASD99_29625 [Mesorhizobium sp. Root695]
MNSPNTIANMTALRHTIIVTEKPATDEAVTGLYFELGRGDVRAYEELQGRKLVPDNCFAMAALADAGVMPSSPSGLLCPSQSSPAILRALSYDANEFRAVKLARRIWLRHRSKPRIIPFTSGRGACSAANCL